MKSEISSTLAPEFEFASFTFPKYVWTLPKGTKAKRLERAKNRVCGAYSHAPKPNKGGSFFYLDSDFMPGMRWQWCDEVSSAIRHTGWFTDEFGDSDKIRGIVFRLPKGRGFLAGWSMGESMASEVASDEVYDTESEAAHAADSLAESVADREREYQESERERLEQEDNDKIETFADEVNA